MSLLSEDKLQWSPVVANSAMNRERGASGVNSYEKELKLNPVSYLTATLQQHGRAAWLDPCCGAGNALWQTAEHFNQLDTPQNLTIHGLDLVDSFSTIPVGTSCLSFEVASVVDWTTTNKFDLVTCSHGLHYVGDKLRVIQTALSCLTTHGVFVANLDLANIMVEQANSVRLLKQLFSEAGIEYNAKNKLIKCIGPAEVKFKLHYLGADDTVGPNYSGQPAVTSHYAPM
jgi:trans-aconitate methyltransferase